MEHIHSNLSDDPLEIKYQIQVEQDTLERLIKFNEEQPFGDQEHFQRLIKYHKDNITKLKQKHDSNRIPGTGTPPERIETLRVNTKERTVGCIEGNNCFKD